jgi:hypothetical protein
MGEHRRYHLAVKWTRVQGVKATWTCVSEWGLCDPAPPNHMAFWGQGAEGTFVH